MTDLRLTAVMKTDITGSTARYRALTAPDLSASLGEHRDLIARLAMAQNGRVIKAEGDSFWIVFPSVTAAARAAVTMQEELSRAQANRGDDRWAMRVVITLGDVLHEKGDIFGDAVALAARIETVTPANEIYLSAAARLAVSQAEVGTSLVDAFVMKGFTEPIPVYRVEQRYRTQLLTEQYILFTDLHGFSQFAAGAEVAAVEKVLDRLLELVGEICREFGGTNRFSSGDAHCLTFIEPERAMAATERIVRQWDEFHRREGIDCTMTAVLHRGSLQLFRSYLYSDDLNAVGALADAVKNRADAVAAFFVTGPASRELTGSRWRERLAPIEIEDAAGSIAGIEVFRCGVPAAEG